MKQSGGEQKRDRAVLRKSCFTIKWFKIPTFALALELELQTNVQLGH